MQTQTTDNNTIVTQDATSISSIQTETQNETVALTPDQQRDLYFSILRREGEAKYFRVAEALTSEYRKVDRLTASHVHSFHCVMVVNVGGHKKSEITEVVALFLDVDAKDEGVKTDENGLAIIPSFPLQPTMIVRSGSGGYHAYWVLSERVKADETEFKTWQLAIAAKYKGDTAVKDLSRTMRVPGTNNVKAEPFNPCSLIHAHPELTYTVQEIVEGLSLDLTAESKINANKRLSNIVNRFTKELKDSEPGQRNHTLYTVSAKAHQKYGSNQTMLTSIQDACFKVWQDFLGKDSEGELSEFNSTWDSGKTSDRAKDSRASTVNINGIEVEAEYSSRGLILVSANLLLACLAKSEIWFNEMSGLIMVGDRPLDDNIITQLCKLCRETLGLPRVGKDFVTEMIHETALENPWHPGKAFLDTLTPQPHHEVIYEIQDSYGISEVDMKGLLYGFQQSIAGIMDPEVALELMVVLVSEKHGTGKTKFLTKMLTINKYLKPHIAPFPKQENKDSILNSIGSNAHIVDECGSQLRDSRWNDTKAMLTQREYQLRLPYGRATTALRRDFGYWGATNDTSLFREEYNRRVIPVEFTRTSVMDGVQEWLDLDALKIRFWEHCYWLYLQNPTLIVDMDVYERMNSDKYQALPDGAEFIDAFQWRSEFYTLEDIRQTLGQRPCSKSDQVIRFSDHKLGSILKALKWEQKQRRIDGKKVRAWYPPALDLTPDEDEAPVEVAY